MRINSLYVIAVVLLCQNVLSAPVQKGKEDRTAKNLAFYDYLQPDEDDYTNYETENEDYTMALDDNEISRTIPGRKRLRTPSATQFNSPIYYIRLPPQPYMFVPGLGYVSQPPQSPVSQFVNLPVSFVANGKPNNIYQWSGGFDFPTPAPPPIPAQIIPQRPQKPLKKPVDSSIHRLPGQFAFNGKPDDIFVLRDSYNSLYSDALQNFYP